jgi:hypothetical protein
VDGLRARVVWSYDETSEFSNDLSAVAPLTRSETPVITQISLKTHPQWAKDKNILRIKVAIESASGTVAEVTPESGATSAPDIAINYMVLDRDAFSDTFERSN